ncbi:hypothetical protein PVK06_035044 [Gossypium arboreum]|uniref:Uncharacterized protein n=1 Tax=Gossypium arboreum TaxID=29729 RepID=A0ABR0NGS5_GOSAR|nr:hypothetical protein PVK06_035044 [Gossypium arboreum]
MPSVFNPGKMLTFTDVAAKPVSLNFHGNFMPENTKSSTVAADEFLHAAIPVLGIQKSWTGSGSDPKLVMA